MDVIIQYDLRSSHWVAWRIEEPNQNEQKSAWIKFVL